MVDWQDAQVEYITARTSIVLCHTLGGAYALEFANSLWFDFDVFYGRRPLRWTFYVYLFVRYMILVSFTVGIVFGNVYSPTENCQALGKTLILLGNTTSNMSTLLFMLRVFAISRQNKIIILVLMAAWMAAWGTQIHGAVVTTTVWQERLSSCFVIDAASAHKVNLTLAGAIDVACSGIMLWYLLRDTAEGSSLWTRLLKHGVIYLGTVSIAYIVPIVMLFLDLNDGMNWMFEPVVLTLMVICSTRLYRDLAVFDMPHRDGPAFTTELRFRPRSAPKFTVGATTTAPVDGGFTYASEQSRSIALEAAKHDDDSSVDSRLDIIPSGAEPRSHLPPDLGDVEAGPDLPPTRTASEG